MFCGFGIPCILLVLNFAWASQKRKKKKEEKSVNNIHDGLFAIFNFYRY